LISTSASGDIVAYQEFAGVEYHQPSDGMKIQSEADLFKGVATILPTDKMPMIRYSDGTVIRADVVCDMGESTKKHDSLKWAHLTMVLNKIATDKGGMEVSHDTPVTEEWVVEEAQKHGYDEDLCAELYAPNYALKPELLCRCPVGKIRVGRHRQHPEVSGGLVGQLSENAMLRDSLKSAGKRDGLIDTMVQISCGFPQAACELRRIKPEVEEHVEALRNMVVFSESSSVLGGGVA